MVLAQRKPLRLLRAGVRARSPGVVLLPIVDRVSELIAIHEANFNQGRDERALLALPVSGKLDVLAGHPGKITIRAGLRDPQKQAHKAPCAAFA